MTKIKVRSNIILRSYPQLKCVLAAQDELSNRTTGAHSVLYSLYTHRQLAWTCRVDGPHNRALNHWQIYLNIPISKCQGRINIFFI